MRSPTVHARFTWALLCALVAIAWPAAGRQPDDATPYSIYWAVGGMHESNPERRVNLGDGPITRGIVILSAADCGMYPVAGPHVIESSPGGRELYIQRRLQKLRTDIAVNIPDAKYAGFVAIDATAWLPYWSGHENAKSDQGPTALDRDFLDDWRDYIRDSRPELLEGKKPEKLEEIFRETWLESTREFWTRTLDECKTLRPGAKWGICGLPITTYFPWVATSDPLQQERLKLLKQAHDIELAWLFDRVNAHFPTLPVPFEGVESRPNWNARQVNKGDIDQYLRLNCVEAHRISRDRPIVVLIYPLYPEAEPTLRGRWLSDNDLGSCFEIPRLCGAAGVAIRGQIGDFNHPQEEWQRIFEDRLLPFAEAFATAAPTPPAEPPHALAHTPNHEQQQQPAGAQPGDGLRFSSPAFSNKELNGAIDRLRFNVFKGKNGKRTPLRREPPHESATVNAPERTEPASPQPK